MSEYVPIAVESALPPTGDIHLDPRDWVVFVMTQRGPGAIVLLVQQGVLTEKIQTDVLDRVSTDVENHVHTGQPLRPWGEHMLEALESAYPDRRIVSELNTFFWQHGISPISE